MSTGKDDIVLDDVCGTCMSEIMLPIQDGWLLSIQHVDAELEADHPVILLLKPPMGGGGM